MSKGDLEKSRDNLKGDLDKSMEISMKTMDLFNLEEMMEKKMEECMGHMGHNMGGNMKRIVMLIQNIE